MPNTLKTLRALADPTRLRILTLLDNEELSVNELQEITRLGQSRISTHLGLLQDSGLLNSRREGKRTYYKIHQGTNGTIHELLQLAIKGGHEMGEYAADQMNLKRIVSLRTEQA